MDGFDTDLWDQIVRAGSLLHYDVDDTIIEQGSSSQDLFIVIAGQVVLTRTANKSTYRIGEIKTRGQPLAHPTTHLNVAKNFAFKASEPETVVLKLTYSAALKLARQYREFLEWMLRDLSSRHMQALTQIRLDRNLPAEIRIGRRLLELVDETGDIHLTQEEIGRFMGISRVTVSKCLSTLEDRKILARRYRRISIHDRQKLELWANQAPA